MIATNTVPLICTMIVLVATRATSNQLQGLSKIQSGHGAPKVSVKMSTSIVQLVSSTRPELTTVASILPPAANKYYLLEPNRVVPTRFESRDALFIGADAIRDSANYRQQMSIFRNLHLNPIGRINSTQYRPDISNRYSSPISDSWRISAPTQTLSFDGSANWAPVPVRDVEDRSSAGRDSMSVGPEHRTPQQTAPTTCHKCERRSIGSMLQSAKNLLTGGIATLKQRSASGYLMIGSSLLAALVPLVALLLPPTVADTSSNNRRLGDNESSSSALSAHNSFSLHARVESIMGWIERSVEHLPNFPRLHPQECVKRSICEAHNAPDKYGAIGFMLRLFFPATNVSSTDRMDDMEYKVINKYRHAAGFGLNKRLESGNATSSACRDKYEDCLVSLLDVGQGLVDVFLKY